MQKETVTKILDSITIPYAEEIRGNITLPSEIDDVAIEWKSSNTSVITDEEADGKKAGIVERNGKSREIKETEKNTKTTRKTIYSVLQKNIYIKQT